jgi:hypothetical protein
LQRDCCDRLQHPIQLQLIIHFLSKILQRFLDFLDVGDVLVDLLGGKLKELH